MTNCFRLEIYSCSILHCAAQTACVCSIWHMTHVHNMIYETCLQHVTHGVAFLFVCFQLPAYLVNFHELCISIVLDQVVTDAIWYGFCFYNSDLHHCYWIQVLCCYDVQWAVSFKLSYLYRQLKMRTILQRSVTSPDINCSSVSEV